MIALVQVQVFVALQIILRANKCVLKNKFEKDNAGEKECLFFHSAIVVFPLTVVL